MGMRHMAVTKGTHSLRDTSSHKQVETLTRVIESDHPYRDGQTTCVAHRRAIRSRIGSKKSYFA